VESFHGKQALSLYQNIRKIKYPPFFQYVDNLWYRVTCCIKAPVIAPALVPEM
jgi:hypothetical protein